MVSSSVVVFDVRPGNPKGFDDYNDLAQHGLQILTPGPGLQRRSAVEHRLRVRRGRAQQGARVLGGRRRCPAAPDRHLQQRDRAGQERPGLDQELRVRQRRRGHHLRERGADRAEGGTRGRDGHPCLHRPDREPGGSRGHLRRAALRDRRGERVRRVPPLATTPRRCTRAQASSVLPTPRRPPRRRRHVRPRSPTCSPSTTSADGTRSATTVFGDPDGIFTKAFAAAQG